MKSMLKALWIAAGLALGASGSAVLLEGGFSRMAKYGIPARPDWPLIALGVILVGCGGWLIRRRT